MYADTHCHLDFDGLSGRIDGLIEEMTAASVEMVVVPSVAASGWGRLVALCQRDKRFFYALGLHPYFIEAHEVSDVLLLDDQLDSLMSSENSRLVAIGEIGLDATRPDIDKQLVLLEKQLGLAEKYKLPVILHVRKLHSQLAGLLKQYVLVGGVIHAFSGSYELMMSYIDLGFKIGVGPVITWRSATKTRAAIAKAPLSSLVLETDSPDMYVEGIEKSKASPLDVIQVFNALALIRPESESDLLAEIWLNSMCLFNK